jgi:hypothetical protein
MLYHFIPERFTILILLTVLHPRHKLEYFRKAAWSEEWIEVAKTIVRNEYEHTYKVAERDLEVEEVAKVNGSFISFLRRLTIA